GDDARGLFAKKFGIEKIAHAQAAAGHLVFVGGADAARRRSDFVGAAGRFGGFVEFAVIRKNQMGAIADVKAAGDVDAGLGKHFDFFDQGDGINDDAHTDDGVLLGTENSAGNELQDVLLLADDDGVAGVMATGNANYIVERASEVVDDFTFAFVTPLRANDDN